MSFLTHKKKSLRQLENERQEMKGKAIATAPSALLCSDISVFLESWNLPNFSSCHSTRMYFVNFTRQHISNIVTSRSSYTHLYNKWNTLLSIPDPSLMCSYFYLIITVWNNSCRVQQSILWRELIYTKI